MQTNQIDFTKPIELIHLSNNSALEHYEVLQVIPHEFANSMFRNAVVIRRNKKIYLVGVDQYGGFSSDHDVFYDLFQLRNKKEVTRETWVNMYKSGFTGVHCSSKERADREKDRSETRYAYFVTKEFSDGSVTNEIILIQE